MHTCRSCMQHSRRQTRVQSSWGENWSNLMSHKYARYCFYSLSSRAVTGNPGNPFPELPDTFSLPDSPGNEFWLSPIPRFPAHHSPIPRTLENFTKKLDNFRKNEQNPKKNKKIRGKSEKCKFFLHLSNFGWFFKEVYSHSIHSTKKSSLKLCL